MTKVTCVLEAYIGLIGHDIFMARHNLEELHRHIRNFELAKRIGAVDSTEVVSRALDIACALYPNRALCLQRSAVLVKMLRTRGIPARLVIGAQKLPFKAHAWVEIEGQIINDRLASREKFLVLEEC